MKVIERTTLTNNKLVNEWEFFKWSKQVTNLQVDITSHCNARCGGCVRNKDGDDVKDDLILEHFDIEVWERIAKEDTWGWFIGDLTLNGNWGDPMMHPHLVKMLNIWTQYHPESSLYLHTNGSMRTTKFWTDLATECRKFTNHLVVFAVDGLEDTHHIYRRKTNFNKIVENIKAFTSAGGRADVTMTLFEHNKHQVKEVEAVAKECNTMYFRLRHSHGDNLLIIPKNEESYRVMASYDIDEHQVTFPERDNSLKMSDSRDYNVYLDANDQVKDAKANDTVCPWYNDRQVQIDPWAVVWPCCHLSLFGVEAGVESGDTMLFNLVDDSFLQARKMNTLKEYSLTEILTNKWFKENLNDALNTGAWKQCQNICGLECNV